MTLLTVPPKCKAVKGQTCWGKWFMQQKRNQWTFPLTHCNRLNIFNWLHICTQLSAIFLYSQPSESTYDKNLASEKVLDVRERDYKAKPRGRRASARFAKCKLLNWIQIICEIFFTRKRQKSARREKEKGSRRRISGSATKYNVGKGHADMIKKKRH